MDPLLHAIELIAQALKSLDDAQVGLSAAPHLDLGLHILTAEARAAEHLSALARGIGSRA